MFIDDTSELRLVTSTDVRRISQETVDDFVKCSEYWSKQSLRAP